MPDNALLLYKLSPNDIPITKAFQEPNISISPLNCYIAFSWINSAVKLLDCLQLQSAVLLSLENSIDFQTWFDRMFIPNQDNGIIIWGDQPRHHSVYLHVTSLPVVSLEDGQIAMLVACRKARMMVERDQDSP